MNTPTLQRPAMRALSISPFSQDGETFLHLHDPESFSGDAAIPQLLANLLALFDGTRTVSQIVEDYQEMGGEELPIWFVEKTIADLDENLMLESPKFRAQLNAVANKYSNAAARPASLAGRAYPDDAPELQQLLDGFNEQAKTLGAPPKPQGEIKGCVVPHIDFTRGGVVESLAYRDLRDQQFDVLVVLGIAHSGVRYPFCATTKDYDTPLGVCRTDVEFVRALQNRVGLQLTDEELAHKNEHSVEFVAVFLQSIANLSSTRIVPIFVWRLSPRNQTENVADAEP